MKNHLLVRLGVASAVASLVVAGSPGPAHAAGESGATLVVRAVDAATGAPVNGFCADLYEIVASACGDGPEIVFTDLAAGDAVLSVGAGDTANYLNSGHIPVTLVEGESTTVTVPLTLGGRVSATVLDRATGQPVAGACIALVVPGRGGLPDGCGPVTDARGRVTSHAVVTGTYQMFVFAPGAYGAQWVGPRNGTGDQREAAQIRVRADRVTPAPAVRLDKAGSISGVVRNPAGEPMPDIDVAITAWDFGVGASQGSTRTDEEGRYTLDGLGPYSWPLAFTSFYDLPRQWSGGGGDRFQAERIRVRPGTTSTYDMDLAPGSTLRGAVTVRGGTVPDFWRLTAANAVTGDPIGVTDSTEAGDPAYDMPVAGGQRVKIRWMADFAEEFRTGWWRNATDITTATPVRVPASGTRTLDLTIG